MSRGIRFRPPRGPESSRKSPRQVSKICDCSPQKLCLCVLFFLPIVSRAFPKESIGDCGRARAPGHSTASGLAGAGFPGSLRQFGENKTHKHIFCRESLNIWKMFGAIFGISWASSGPRVAGNGFSAKNDSQFRGRDSNPCPGDPLRGHLSFLKASPQKTAKCYVYVFSVLPSYPPV